MYKKLGLVVVVCILLAGLIASCASPATSSTTTGQSSTSTQTTAASTTKTPVTPKLLTWGVLDVGSVGYTACGFAAETIKDKFGVTVRLVPVGNDVGRLILARAGSVQMVNFDITAYNARAGVVDFANRAWGPQQLRLLYQLTGAGTMSGLAVLGDSQIKTLSDLKGKKVPFAIAFTSHNNAIESALAFAGLTWNDVVKVEFPSYAATIDGLLEGKIDVCLSNTTSPNAVRIVSKAGIRYLPMPESDTIGWQRFHNIIPGSFPASTSSGPGLSATNVAQVWSTPNTWESYPTLDEDIAYFTTKALAESYPLYKDKQERLSNGAVDQVLNVVGKLPYAFHPGSIRYFKEIGKWTPAIEAWNNKILEREDKMLKAWAACLAEADASKLTEDKLPALWDKYRKEIPPVQ